MTPHPPLPTPTCFHHGRDDMKNGGFTPRTLNQGGVLEPGRRADFSPHQEGVRQGYPPAGVSGVRGQQRARRGWEDNINNIRRLAGFGLVGWGVAYLYTICAAHACRLCVGPYKLNTYVYI